MVINATFNNISAISWRSVLLVEEPDYQKKTIELSQGIDKVAIYCCIKYTSPSAGFEFTASVLIDTYCTGSLKANYHTITTTTIPSQPIQLSSLVLMYYTFI